MRKHLRHPQQPSKAFCGIDITVPGTQSTELPPFCTCFHCLKEWSHWTRTAAGRAYLEEMTGAPH